MVHAIYLSCIVLHIIIVQLLYHYQCPLHKDYIQRSLMLIDSVENIEWNQIALLDYIDIYKVRIYRV